MLTERLFTLLFKPGLWVAHADKTYHHFSYNLFQTAAMPKVKKSKGGGGEKSAGVALADQILQADTIRARGRVKTRDSRPDADDTYVDERLSRKILQQARIQQEELQTEYGLAPEKKKAPVTTLGRASHLKVVFSCWEFILMREIHSPLLNLVNEDTAI